MISFFFLSCKEEIKEDITPKKPNILFVLVDDLGIKDLGFTGSTFYETPNIDKLAKKGSVFTQGYANSRVCSPSRASILTGLARNLERSGEKQKDMINFYPQIMFLVYPVKMLL
jgi:arylsulfatase A-like enzyme